MPLLENLNRRLAELKAQGLARRLRPASGIDFTSNDYLGLAQHPAMSDAVREALDAAEGVGSGGSRLLRGNHSRHEDLETFAAAHFGAESALLFGSGYDANLALLSALPDRRDAILYDERVHASMKEGLRASFAAKYSFRHNDLEDLQKTAQRARQRGARTLFFAAESLYSMDGDQAPLAGLLTLAEKFAATLLLDEAHATGVLGPSGRGLAEGHDQQRIIRVHTCGKALGASGALVSAPRVVRDFLVNTARPFLYTTAPPPLLASAIRRGLELTQSESWRREKLLTLCAEAAERLAKAAINWRVQASGSQIIPIIIGDAETAVRAADALQTRGFDVRAVRPPTVAEGSARLRISLSCERSPEELGGLVRALEEVSREF